MAKRQHQADEAALHYLEVERTLAPRSKRAHRTLLVLCGLLVGVLGLALCFLPHADYSPTEKRELAAPPELSVQSLLEGGFMHDVSDFCADQFPLRASFVKLKARLELLLGKGQNNGVLRGKQGQLFTLPDLTEQTRQNIKQNVRSMKQLGQTLEANDIPFTVAIVPRAIDVNVHLLPDAFDRSCVESVWDWLQEGESAPPMLLLTDALRTQAERGQAVWYKTDHHWTTLGAYYAYAALGESLGYTPYPLTDFKQTTVCDDFYGTAFAASGMHWTEPDSITLFRFEGDDRYQTTVVEGGEPAATLQGLYDTEALSTQDQYEVFLGGTHTRIEVSNPSGPDLPTLVLLKDSFAQSLAPFLARHYHLILIDPRTYKSATASLTDAVLQESPDKVLLLCGIQTLCEVGSLKSLSFR